MKQRYFSLVKEGRVAVIDIYGDITSWAWPESGDISMAILSRQLEELGDVDEIIVHINSYGGEVAEGIAIYNVLRNHPAKVTTVCDGMACSIASVVFMAGDERVMHEASLLMIHNAWSAGCGNAAELRKQADDLDVITEASKAAYLSRVSIDAEELTAMMDAETWIVPADAVGMGFATKVEDFGAASGPSQCARRAVMEAILQSTQAGSDDDDPDDAEEDPEEPGGKDDPGGDDGEDEEEKPNEALQRLGRFFSAMNE